MERTSGSKRGKRNDGYRHFRKILLGLAIIMIIAWAIWVGMIFRIYWLLGRYAVKLFYAVLKILRTP